MVAEHNGQEPSLAAGEVIDGRYQLGKLIGAGGIGSVYRAKRLKLERTLAIKFLQTARATDQVFVRRFEREAMAMSRLYHVHCVALVDYGVHQGRPYLVMEYVPGKTLAAALGEGPLQPRRAVDIMLQILDALEYFHRHNVVHRDIKADNVMLTSSEGKRDFVKMLDLGMAKLLAGAGSDIAVSAKGVIVGTPSAMSPEQIRELPIDGRSDIYSAGVLLYHLIAGRKPFEGATPVAVLKQHLDAEPTPLRAVMGNDTISPELDQVVLRALAKEREHRFQSAQKMAMALLATQEGQGLRPDAEELPAPANVEQKPGVPIWALMGWIMFGLVCVAVTIFALITTRSPADKSRVQPATRLAVTRDLDAQSADGPVPVRTAAEADQDANSDDPDVPPAALPAEDPALASPTPGLAAGDDASGATIDGGVAAEVLSAPAATAALPDAAVTDDGAMRDDDASGMASTIPPSIAPAELLSSSPQWHAHRARALALVAEQRYQDAIAEVRAALRLAPEARGDAGLIKAIIGTLALPDGDKISVPYFVAAFGDEPAAIQALLEAVTDGSTWYVRHHAWIAANKLGKHAQTDRVGMWLTDFRQAQTCRMIERSFRQLLASTDPRARAIIDEIKQWPPEEQARYRACLGDQLSTR